MVSATGDGQKRGYNWDSEEDSESEECSRPKKKKKKAKSREDKENKVQDTVDHLKERHGSKFTSMQLRIWAEMITGGMYTSKESQSKKVSEQSPSTVTRAITDAACAITNALSPKPSTTLPIQGASCSPIKAIESRSKQLSELNSLKSIGILTEGEYVSEKQAIMDLLKKINH